MENNTYTESVAVGDFNTNNNIDILTTNYWNNDFGYGDGNFAKMKIYLSGTNFYPISAA
ncbi:unnamed protein product, partial [Rotaria magnacalcarata]